MNVKNLLAAGCVMVAVIAAAQIDIGQSISDFEVPEYDKNGNMTSCLYGDHAEFLGNGTVKIINLKLEFFRENKLDMRVTAPECEYNQVKKEGWSEKSVRIARDNMVVTGEGFTWDIDKEKLSIKNKAQVVIKDVYRRVEQGEDE
jgi:hypothetical protein